MPSFNIGEIILLVVLAVLIFGPEKLPDLARKTARVINYVRNIANDARGQLREQLGPEFDDIHLSDLDPRNLSAKLLGEDTVRDLAEVKQTATSAASDISRTATVPAPLLPAGAGETTPRPARVAFDPEAT